MEQCEITVRKPAEQLDRRAITDLVRTACELQSTVTVRLSEVEVNAKSLLGMIALQIRPGMNLTVTAKGADEKTALAKICEQLS